MRFNSKILNGILAVIMAILPLSSAMAGSATEMAAELNSTWNAALNRGDAAGLAELYAEDAVVSPGNGETLKGRDSIRELFQSFIDSGIHDHSIEIIEAYKSGNILHEVARWQAHGKDSDGETTSFGGILINTFRRDADGVWRSQAHVWNTNN